MLKGHFREQAASSDARCLESRSHLALPEGVALENEPELALGLVAAVPAADVEARACFSSAWSDSMIARRLSAGVRVDGANGVRQLGHSLLLRSQPRMHSSQNECAQGNVTAR